MQSSTIFIYWTNIYCDSQSKIWKDSKGCFPYTPALSSVSTQTLPPYPVTSSLTFICCQGITWHSWKLSDKHGQDFTNSTLWIWRRNWPLKQWCELSMRTVAGEGRWEDGQYFRAGEHFKNRKSPPSTERLSKSKFREHIWKQTQTTHKYKRGSSSYKSPRKYKSK